MRIIADFHIHSKYARSTSKDLNLPNIDKWAKIKGITLIGTGDFTHPAWMSEIKSQLEPAGNGFYTLKKELELDSPVAGKVYFVPTVEISSIYTQGGKMRRIHTVLIMSSVEKAEEFRLKLDPIVNLRSDGRPIVGISAKGIAKYALDIDQKCLVIPSHIWTPWFAMFGSKSGFDSVEECFEEMADKIYAFETGISSDPEMNWQLSSLDNLTILSNSDAHSGVKLGRESNVFEIPEKEFNYDEIYRIIKEKDTSRFKMTIEYFPEEGMYHFDGHRSCGDGVRLSPEQSKKLKNICPVCGKTLTIGVLHRINDLADRKLGDHPDEVIPFKKLIPLNEIISQALDKGVGTKSVKNVYFEMIEKFGAEYPLLLDLDISKIKEVNPKIAEAIERVRDGRLTINPGYDGTYGEVTIFKD